MLKKEKVVHHQFFVISTGASCPWGELSVGRVVMGRVIPGASCPWGELSVGQVVHGASFPLGELSMGRIVHGGRCRGASLMGRVVREASGPGTFPGSYLHTVLTVV